MAGRSEKGYGSVYEQAGKWVYAFPVGKRLNPRTGKTETAKEYQRFTTRKQADEAKRSRIKALDSGTAIQRTKETLGDYLRWWMQTKQPNVRAGTFYNYHLALTKHVIPDTVLSNKRLVDVTTTALLDFYTRLDKAGVTPTRRYKIHRILTTAFATAVPDRLAVNPCTKIKSKDLPQYQARERDYWTDLQEIRRFRDAMIRETHHYDRLWLFLLLSGLRESEAFGLTQKDINFQRHTVEVTHGAVWIKDKLVINGPKTKKSKRTVYLPDTAMDCLKQSYGDYFFRTSHSTVPKRANLIRNLKAACKRAGVTEITPHLLRHAHISLCIHQGMPISEIAERVGHADYRLIEKIYAHVVGEQAASVRKLDNF